MPFLCYAYFMLGRTYKMSKSTVTRRRNMSLVCGYAYFTSVNQALYYRNFHNLATNLIAELNKPLKIITLLKKHSSEFRLPEQVIHNIIVKIFPVLRGRKLHSNFIKNCSKRIPDAGCRFNLHWKPIDTKSGNFVIKYYNDRLTKKKAF